MRKSRKKISRRSQARKLHRFPVQKRLHDKVLAAQWDPTKTVSQNFKRIRADAILGNRLPSRFEPTTKRLSEPDAKIISALLAKHKEDEHKTMALDISINRWQWTEGEIKKKIALFRDSQVAAPIGKLMQVNDKSKAESLKLKAKKMREREAEKAERRRQKQQAWENAERNRSSREQKADRDKVLVTADRNHQYGDGTSSEDSSEGAECSDENVGSDSDDDSAGDSDDEDADASDSETVDASDS